MNNILVAIVLAHVQCPGIRAIKQVSCLFNKYVKFYQMNITFTQCKFQTDS